MKKFKCNEDYFECIDSQEKAYLLGFFLADGGTCISSSCTSSYRHQVALSITDLCIVEKYQELICPNNTISYSNYTKGAINRKPVCSIRWTSTKMKEDLEKLYNMKLRKTYDFTYKMNFDNIPKELIRHFIRGYFDGDGHVSFSVLKRQFTLAIYGGSKYFLEQIGEIFKQEFNVEYKFNSKKTKNVELFGLRFDCKHKRKPFIEKLVDYFYKDSTIFLKRKEDKFKAYLNTVLI